MTPTRVAGRTFAALAVPAYRRFWSTGLVSGAGTAMQGIALDWYVLELTGSGTAVGWAVGLQWAPVLLFGLWGGVLADRYPRRTLLLVAQWLYALQATVLAVAVLTGHAPLALLYVLAFALGCVFTVENPARLAFVTELVGPALIPNAAGLNILSLNAARLVGPAIAGVLVAQIGAGWVFVVNAASFGVVLVGLATIRPLPRPVSPRTPWRGAGPAGVRYVAGRPGLVAVFTVFAVVAAFGLTFPASLTLFADRVFDTGSVGLGFMSTALAVGTVLGTLYGARRAHPTVRSVVVGALAFGGCAGLAAGAPTYPLFLVLLVPVGAALMVLNTAVSGYVQIDVTEAVRGRVMAVYTVVSMGGMALGGPVVGAISQHAGARWGLLAGGVASVLGALAVAGWLARRPAPGTPAPATPAPVTPVPTRGTVPCPTGGTP